MLQRLHLLPLFVAGFVLAWNVSLAGWIASRRDRNVVFARLTGLAGLLIAPAAILAIASSTDAGARTITGVAWLWPVSCLLVALQATFATVRRLVSSSVGVPIVLYNLVLAAVAVGDDLVARTGQAPLLLQGAVAARDAVIGILMGRAALASPLAIMVPLLAPAYPARWRFSALLRALLVLYAAATMTLLVIEWPRGVGAVRSYAEAATVVVPREASSLALGLRLLPTVTGLPGSRAVRVGAQLTDIVSPDALLVVIRTRAVRGSGLDSLARVLAPYRADSVRLLVALAFEQEDALAVRDAPALAARLRIDALERVTERLRPYAVVPALPPMLPDARSAPTAPARWWDEHLTSSAAAIHRVRPATRVLWLATTFDAADSARFAWASAPGAPIDGVGFAPSPSFGGLPSLDARLRTADRWVAARPDSGAPVWILTAGLPRAHGDAAQLGAVRHVLAWASARPWVRGVIVGEPLDEVTLLGLVAANGRRRAVVEMLRDVLPRGDGPR